MATERAGVCSRCEAPLRRRSRLAEVAWCDSCRRVGPDPRRDLPAGFYRREAVVAALADYDFGVVFRGVRRVTGWSQQMLGGLVGLDQNRISEIERGVSRLRDVALVAQVATALGIPPVVLGFGGSATTVVGQYGGARSKVGSWVDRRDFVQHTASLALAVAGLATLDLDRLTALLPYADPTGHRQVGARDVEVIEQATAAFASQDFAIGSGPVRDVAVGQLRATLPLLGAQMTEETRPRLCLAVARLATQAGWMSLQVHQDDAARRLWMIALQVARASDHPLSVDQTVFVLYDMALQAVALGRPEEALQLTQLGHTAAVSGHPVSAATSSCLAYVQARATAARNDAAGCGRALGECVEHFAKINPAHESWADYLDESLLARFQGVAYYELALATHDPRAAAQAVSLLRQAADGFSPDFARFRATTLSDLAGAHALAGDADTAVRVGHQAVDAVTALHSPRAYDRLRVLHTALEPLRTNPAVAELRDRLTNTAT